MRKFLPLLTLFVFPLFIFAQDATIKGKVTDKSDREELPGVKVLVDGGKAGALTNLTGDFTIKVDAGSHVVTVQYEGYDNYEESVTLASGEKVELDIKLGSEKNDTRLKVVTISGSQFEKNLTEESTSIDIIDKDLIRNNNATELGEAVDRSVGTQVIDGQILIRGGSAWSYGVGSRTAVLVDNVSFTSGDLGEAQMKQVPLENTEQIEVIKGAGSVVYGSSALNGVVNVRTGWPGAEPTTEITAFTGIYDNPRRKELKWWKVSRTFSGMSLSHRQRFGSWDLVVGGNVNNSNGYLKDNDETRYRGNVKLRHRNPNIPGLTYGIDANMMYDNSGRFFIMMDLDTNAYVPDDPNIDRYLRTNIDPHVIYTGANGYRHRILGRYMNVYRFASNDSSVNANSNKYSLEYQVHKKYPIGLTLTAGIPGSFSVNKSNLYPGQRFTAAAAVYGLLEYKWKRLVASAGGRYEFNSVFTNNKLCNDPIMVDSLNLGPTECASIYEFTKPVFQVGLNYQVGKATWLRASWGQSYRLPSVGERYITAEFSILKILPNPDLKPESGWSSEIGVKQALKINKWLGYFDFSMFWNEYDDFVEYQLGVWNPPGTPPSLEWLGLKPNNIDLARIYGIEASVMGKGKIGPVEVRTLFGWTYQYPGNLQYDSTQKNLGVYLGNAFKYMFKRLDYDLDDPDPAMVVTGETRQISVLQFRNRHLIKGDIEFIYKDFSIGGNFLYATFAEYIQPMFFIAVPSLDKFAAQHEKGDFIMSLRAGYTLREKLRFGFIIKNLTNLEYGFRAGKLEAPRSFTLQLNYKF